MLGTGIGTDLVTAFYQAQGRHNRQLRVLQEKTLCKWKKKDIERIKATRAARDSAIAALSFAQVLQHVEGLSRERAESIAEGKSLGHEVRKAVA